MLSSAEEVIDLMETRVDEGESIDSALKRFRRQCQRDGILAEIKKREFYEKPSVRRKKKMLAARRRRA
jgi:small subunit ribosomal protein S21